MTESAGTTITDIKNNLVVTVEGSGASLDFTGADYIKIVNGAPLSLSSGQWQPYLEGKKFIVLAALKITETGANSPIVAVGDISGVTGTTEGGRWVARGLGGASNSPFHTAYGVAKMLGDPYTSGHDVTRKLNSTSADLTGTLYNGQDIYIINIGDGETNTSLTARGLAGDIKIEADIYDTATYPKTLPPLSGFTAPPSDINGGFTPLPYLRWENCGLYGLAVFYFDVIPENHEWMCRWTVQQWAMGNKVIHPGLLT